MPQPAIIVQLPQPCQQSWAAMTPTAGGRHCAACQHEVVDFTAFTDGELAAYLARPGQIPCGRFYQSQLNRVLLPAARPVAGWRRWWGAVAAVLGLGSLATPARAQVPLSGAPRKQVTHAGKPFQAKSRRPPAAHPARAQAVRGETVPLDLTTSGAPAVLIAPDTARSPKP